jgi:putative pyruvate formate lyase activating enzyme
MTGAALARYYRILDGDEKAKYLIAKARFVDVHLVDSSAQLWEAHRSALLRKGGSTEGRGSVSLLDLKVELARRMLKNCQLCERRCRVDRTTEESGFCGVGDAKISSEFIHMGEEPDLVPSYTIFFAGCTFRCVFCQNWDISTRPDSGVRGNPRELARRIEGRVGRLAGGIRNINWVGGDPTSNLPFILQTLSECSADIPQVWNSNMYLSEEAMSLLDGVIDVYLTDFKYGNDKCAMRLSDAPNYFTIVSRNHLLAQAQAEIIVRHLVMPGHVECCTIPVLEWVAGNLSNVKVNVMAQYRPEHRAKDFEDISRPLKMKEYALAVETAEKLGLDLCD